jgi:hypothetical protein
MAFDPEEIVTLNGQGQMTLRTAVNRVAGSGLAGSGGHNLSGGRAVDSGSNPNRKDRGGVGTVGSSRAFGSADHSRNHPCRARLSHLTSQEIA